MNKKRMIDCFFIGHNEMDFCEYERSIREMGTNSGAYRDLNLSFYHYNDKPHHASEIFNLLYSRGGSPEPLRSVESFSAAIGYLGTYLQRRGFTFDFINSFQEDKDELREKLQEGNILTIAVITTLYVSVFPILKIVDFIKKYNRSARIIIGGPFVSTQARNMEPMVFQYMLKSIDADFYVNNSQGEAALVNIIKFLKGSTGHLPLNRIDNIYYKTADGYLTNGFSRENNTLSENMVNWDLFSNRLGEIVNVRTAISCPFKCAFCGFPAHAGKHQTATIDAVEKELNSLAKIDSLKSVLFIDDTLNVPQKRFKEFLRMLIKNRYRFDWYANFRCQYADRETVELLKESGCRGVLLGLESGNDQILKNMNKSITTHQYLRGISLLKEYEIITYGSFIIGFPGETRETVNDTIRLIEESGLDFFRTQLWYCEQITPIWKERETYHIKGSQFEWSHATMNSRQASDIIDEIFLSLKNALWLPQYGFDFPGIFHLLRRGLTIGQVKEFINNFNTKIKEKLVPTPREEIGRESATAGKQLCVKLIHCGNISISNSRDQEQKNIFFMPMGLFPLGNVLKENGFDVELLHFDLQPGKTLVEILDLNRVDIVGFDCHWVNQALSVLETAAAIKEINPRVFIVLGGFTASLFAREILDHYSQIDAVIRGDGEIPIVELCRELSLLTPSPSIKNPEKVQNLAWRDTGGNTILNDISYVAKAEDMEKLDFAAIDLLRNWQSYRYLSRLYSSFTPISTTPMFLLEPGRGCEYACSFCGGNCRAQARMNNRKQTVFRSVESVVETIKKAISFGFQTFYTCMESEDSNDWYIKLFHRIKEEKLVLNFGYGCWRLPPQPLVDALSQACRQTVIEISPETSDLQLRKKNKDIRIFYTNRQLENCLDYIRKKGNVKVQLFFGYYLSSDTEETILSTVNYIMKLLLKFPGLLEIEYANFSTDPGSLYFFSPDKYDIDIKVRNFRDYIKYLRENYIEKTGSPADMTEYKPVYITEEQDVNIRLKVSLFNYLFSFYRKSVSYMLEKTGPDIIMKLLTETDIPGCLAGPGNKFSPDEIKKCLLIQAEKGGILDPDLTGLIIFECEKQESDYRVSKPTTQLFLDFEREEIPADSRWLRELPGEDDEVEAISIDFDI